MHVGGVVQCGISVQGDSHPKTEKWGLRRWWSPEWKGELRDL